MWQLLPGTLAAQGYITLLSTGCKRIGQVTPTQLGKMTTRSFKTLALLLLLREGTAVEAMPSLAGLASTCAGARQEPVPTTQSLSTEVYCHAFFAYVHIVSVASSPSWQLQKYCTWLRQ